LGDYQLLPTLTDVLIKELRAVGMQYDDRRAAAIAGLLHLRRYDIIRDAKAHDGKPETFGYGLEPWKPIEPLVRELLKAWTPLYGLVGDELFERFATNPKSMWEVAAPWISEFPYLRSAFESGLRKMAGTSVGPNTLHAMAALFPGSEELCETCLTILEENKHPHRDATEIASRILGQHFGGDQVTLERLRRNKNFLNGPSRWRPNRYWRVLLAMCYGWPQAPELQEWLNIPRAQWEGMPWHISLHLGRIAKKPAWVLRDMDMILSSNADRIGTRDDEISRALQLWASEEGNRSFLLSWLDRSQPSDAATAVGLLSGSGSIDSELRTRMMRLFEQELRGDEYPPRVGLDLSVGQLRVIAESIYDTIWS
jgi:hypothetical protein